MTELDWLLTNAPELENDLFWNSRAIEYDFDYDIISETGQFIEKSRFCVSNNRYDINLPTKPPNFKMGLSGDTSAIDEIFDLVEEDISDVAGKVLVKESHEEIDQLTTGVEDIKVIYHSADQKLDLKKLKPKAATWARAVTAFPSDYNIVVPDPPAVIYPFELDPFQKEAIYHLEKGESVFVAAHTSAGKTAVAEYAIGLCQRHMTRAIYTSPIKALSNQKFRDFREIFGKEHVGLLTGDVQINQDAADCLIMTTEILRSMLYKDSDVIREVEWVIFDEVHYVNDAERGVVWEEVIIMLPPHVKLVLLSATTPNTFEFADWVGRTRSKIVHVASTLYRPVPLEHFVYYHKEQFKIVDATRAWLEEGYKAAQTKYQSKSKQAVIGGSVFVELVYYLQKKSLLPCVIFTFSRRKCEEYADSLSGVDLNNSATDHSAVHYFFTLAVSKLSPNDRDLPQLLRMGEMLKRGIAVHHSGLLPIMKEAVEMLFARGYVKVLFATETFAMGVNMPARTVVFSGLKKHDGVNFRLLHPGEYTQMAGRAGRRGKDSIGTVILLPSNDELPSTLTLQSVILGTPTKLTSQFRLTYGMILNLLRVEALRVEEMLKRSFSENTSQKRRPEEETALQQIEEQISKFPRIECEDCYNEVLLKKSISFMSLCKRLFSRLMTDQFSKFGSRYLECGRIILITGSAGYRYGLLTCRSSKSMTVLTIQDNQEPVPFPPYVIMKLPQPFTIHSLISKEISSDHIVLVTKTKFKFTDTSERNILELKQQFSDFLIQKGRHAFIKSEELEVPYFKSFEIDEVRIKRDVLLNELSFEPVDDCPKYLEHYSHFYKQQTLVGRLAEMKFAASDNSLVLLPDYHARVDVLKNLYLIDAVSGSVQVKGRVGCEIRTVEGGMLLLIIELLFTGYLSTLECPELAAVLSCLYFQEKSESVNDDLDGLPESLVSACHEFLDKADNLTLLQRDLGVSVSSEDMPLKFGLVRVIYQWAQGCPFAQIASMTDVLEGSIVRCVVRLEEGLRELCHATKIMGDLELAEKFEQAAIMIKRDICFASSLYL